MQLIFGPASGFSRKVRVVAHELGIMDRIEHRQLSPQTDARALGGLNPLGKIPVLVDGATVLYDSAVICEYLCDRHGGEKLLPQRGPARWEVLRFAALGDGVTEAGMAARAEAARTTGGQPSPAMQWQIDKISRSLDHIENSSTGQAFLSSAFPDLGHIAIGCAIGWLQFRLPTLDLLASRPALAAWVTRIHARPSFVATMPTS